MFVAMNRTEMEIKHRHSTERRSVNATSDFLMCRLALFDHSCNPGSQIAEQLGNRASYQKVAGSIPGRALLRFGNVPVLTASRSG